jgi:hypothetical protein
MKFLWSLVRHFLLIGNVILTFLLSQPHLNNDRTKFCEYLVFWTFASVIALPFSLTFAACLYALLSIHKGFNIQYSLARRS